MATTLTGANQKTEWWDLREVGSSVCFLLTGDFNQNVGIHYSNLETFDKETGYTVGTAFYNAAIGPLELPFGLANYVRFFSGVSWGVGTVCTPSFARAKDNNGKNYNVPVQKGVNG